MHAQGSQPPAPQAAGPRFVCTFGHGDNAIAVIRKQRAGYVVRRPVADGRHAWRSFSQLLAAMAFAESIDPLQHTLA